MCSIIVLAFVAVCTKQAHAINFKIQPKENLCFHEITHKGNKVLAFFDVLSWGYGAYIYMTVTSPGGHELKKFDAESEGRIDFIATEDGEHSFCFQNAQTETEISFWVNTESDSALTDVAKEGTSLLLFSFFKKRKSPLLNNCPSDTSYSQNRTCQ